MSEADPNEPVDTGLFSSPLGPGLSRAYSEALSTGLPVFPAGVDASNPMNAAPFAARMEDFERDFAFNGHRQRLLAALTRALDAVVVDAAEPLFMIVGGSYLDRASQEPRDLDCAVFYRRQGDGAPASPSGLPDAQAAAHEAGLDMRLLPFDADPLLVAKMIGYFCLLYAQERREGDTSAILMIDLSAFGRAAEPRVR